MFYKKIPLINISDYLTYIKYNPNKHFQFDIVYNYITHIQVFGHNLNTDTPEIQNQDDYVILFYFSENMRDVKSRKRLKESETFHFEELKEKNGSLSYYIRIEKDLIKLHSVLKFLVEEIYQFKKTEFYHVNFYEIKSESDIQQITHFKINRLRELFK